MRREARAARAALDRLQGRGKTTRIPDEARQLLVAYVRTARGRRVPWRAISAEVGLSVTVMRRWLRTEGTATHRLRPVRIAEPAVPRSVSVVAPSGHRVEGLSLEAAAQLLGLLA